MSWWDRKAATVQAMNRYSESQRDDVYTDEEVRRATVYTREDMGLLASLISSLNRIHNLTNTLLFLILLALCVIAYKI